MGKMVFVAICICVCGCGGGAGDDEWSAKRSETVPVTATVTMGGSPLAGASVAFLPALEEGRGASGLSGEDGKLTLTTYKPGDGVIPGEYRVTVTKVQQSSVEVTDDPDDPNYGNEDEEELNEEPQSLIPERYGVADDSGFSADVTESGPNEFTFDLEQ